MSTPSDRPDRPTRYPGERSRWLVPSDSQPDFPVLVDMDEYDGIGWCACEDFQFRHQPLLERGEHKAVGPDDAFRCKHLRAVAELMICQRCEGCGQIANDEDGTPWTQWENLPVKNAAAVISGIVKPIPCPNCDGTGKTS